MLEINNYYIKAALRIFFFDTLRCSKNVIKIQTSYLLYKIMNTDCKSSNDYQTIKVSLKYLGRD